MPWQLKTQLLFPWMFQAFEALRWDNLQHREEDEDNEIAQQVGRHLQDEDNANEQLEARSHTHTRAD